MPCRLANGRVVTIYINTLEALPILPWIWMVLLQFGSPASMFLPACCTSLGTSFPTCAARLKEEERPGSDHTCSGQHKHPTAVKPIEELETNLGPWQAGPGCRPPLYRCITSDSEDGSAPEGLHERDRRGESQVLLLPSPEKAGRGASLS
jgi:hypothetical protein